MLMFNWPMDKSPQRRPSYRLGIGSFALYLSVGLSGLAVSAPRAIAQSIAESSSSDFWAEANAIVTSQARWFDRTEQTLRQPEAQLPQILSVKLLPQLLAMDRFIQRYDRNGVALCQSDRGLTQLAQNTGFDSAQVEAYCAIAQMSRDLTPLRDRLSQRSAQFNGTPGSLTRTPMFKTQIGTQRFFPRSPEQFNLMAPPASAPDQLLRPYPQTVGIQRFKQARANARPAIAPAFRPPSDILELIEQGRGQLARIQVNQPASVQSFNTPRGTQLSTAQLNAARQLNPAPAAKYAVRSDERAIYTAFLAQPGTGISRVYPTQAFVTDRNRLDPNQIPMPFGLRVEDGQFLVTGEALNYGFMSAIGEQDLAGLELDDVSDTLPELFNTYQPPNTLAELQNHQRRFLIGKDTPINATSPAALKQTYVMRLVQYQLPELITRGRALEPGERGDLKTHLRHSGSDQLIAFRPVIQRNDGSYTILWKVLKQQSAPQITDLDRYVSTHLKTRSRN
ncbi:MAG: hypothetical protein RLZZ511_3475 [Cyanobacteriota bacterium]